MANSYSTGAVIIDTQTSADFAAIGQLASIVVADTGTPGAKTTIIQIDGKIIATVVLNAAQTTVAIPVDGKFVNASVAVPTLGTGVKVYFIFK
jgi:hypothetical protein